MIPVSMIWRHNEYEADKAAYRALGSPGALADTLDMAEQRAKEVKASMGAAAIPNAERPAWLQDIITTARKPFSAHPERKHRTELLRKEAEKEIQPTGQHSRG